MLALRAGRLIDGTGADAYGPATLLVEDGKISAVGPSDAIKVSEGTQVIDLGTLTLLPGLVDAHTHFGLTFPGSNPQVSSNYEMLLLAVERAKKCLLSGVTTARTLSERDFVDVAYRRGIDEGWIAGPRVLIATRGLQTLHSDVSVTDIHVNGVDDVRRVVRENLAAGADVIKLYLTPPSLSVNPTLAYFARVEIEAAVEEAHRAGKPVAVHAHGGRAVDDAIAAGVDTIEHGLWITREQFERMAERGIWLIGTQTIRLWEDNAPHPPERLRAAREATSKNLVVARNAGVRFTVGTDGAHGLMFFELECLVRVGFSCMEALLAGTKLAAEAIGLGARTGTLQPGKWADVIGVTGDPLTDISAMRNAAFVMKAGNIITSVTPHQ